MNDTKYIITEETYPFEQLPVYAYMSPDPLDEDGYFEIEFIEDLPGFKKDCTDEPLFDEANLLFYETLLREVKDHFTKAAGFLWPLLKAIQFRSIQICVDVTGAIHSERGMASYLIDNTDTEKGIYVFFAHRSLLFRYLKSIYHADFRLTLHDKCMWEHELIHLLDDANLKKSAVYRDSPAKADILKYYILKYRDEGIADLFYLLSGGNEIKSLETALSLFVAELARVKDLLNNSQLSNIEKFREEIFSSYNFYEIGPWIIMKIILRSNDQEIRKLAEKCIKMIESSRFVDHNDIVNLIQVALTIDNASFMSELTNIINTKFIIYEQK